MRFSRWVVGRVLGPAEQLVEGQSQSQSQLVEFKLMQTGMDLLAVVGET